MPSLRKNNTRQSEIPLSARLGEQIFVDAERVLSFGTAAPHSAHFLWNSVIV